MSKKSGIVVVSAVASVLLCTGLGYQAKQRWVKELARAEGAAPGGAGVDWIVFGGGPLPESNEVSIENDLALAAKTLPGDGRLFFAGGEGTKSVRVQAAEAPEHDLRGRLGEIFDPRPSRQSNYRPTELTGASPATETNLIETLEDALQVGDRPLLVWISGHGDRGETPRENAILTWGNGVVTPPDVAEVLARTGSKRPTRLIVTTCFSGGFAEIAFADADPASGAASADACGLFASTADLEAGGCDPDPVRGNHDGYAVHVLNALTRTTRDGTPIERSKLDVGADGKVSLLDAHTWARLESGSIDVPTTTSERWLREFAGDGVGAEPLALPHEDAIIAEFSASLGVTSREDVETRLEALTTEIEGAVLAESEAIATESEVYRKLAAALLSRWPVLNDPWRADWRETMDGEREAIERFLDSSEEYSALGAAMKSTNAAANRRAELEVRRAPLLRVQRAYETKLLAGALKQRGGANWAEFERLRACEDSVP